MNIRNQAGLYEIVCSRNSHRYIGSSINIRNRFWDHRTSLRNRYHANPHLQASWNLYGPDAFEFRPLVVMPREDHIALREAEARLIAAHSKAGALLFNARPDGIGPPPVTEEARAKIRASHVGRVVSSVTRAKMSASARERTNRTFSPEHRAAISAAKKGKPLSEANRIALRNAKRKPPSAETVEKRAAKLRGRKMSAEKKAIYSAAATRREAARRAIRVSL